MVGALAVVPLVSLAPSLGAQPDGKGIVARSCGKCHGLNRVEGSRKDAAAWEKTLDRMIKKGADVKAEERAAVLAYLQTLKK
jgi:mono/diheme cytochrome c family protein